MKTRPKDLGTQFETEIVKAVRATGLKARRIAEGGRNDEGDIEILVGGGDRVVVECKARANLNVHKVLAAARSKTSDPAVLVWKRLVRKDGDARRSTDGERVVVVLTLDHFLSLAEAHQALEFEHGRGSSWD